MTNLDRLHEVSLYYDWVPRTAGRTTHDCHLVAGLVALGEPQVLCLLPELRWLNHVYPVVASTLQEYGFSAQRITLRSFQVENSTVRFMSKELELRGYSHDVPVVVFDGLGLLPEIKFYGFFDDYLAPLEGFVKALAGDEHELCQTLVAFDKAKTYF